MISAPVVIRFRFRHAVARASLATGKGDAEWPIHPDRVFQALVAEASSAAGGDLGPDAIEALEDLTAAGEPTITCPEARPIDVATHYLPPDYLVLKQRNAKSVRGNQPLQAIPGMQLIGDATITYRWPGELSDQSRETLAQLVRGVRYLGRSDSYVQGEMLDDAPSATWEPCEPRDQQIWLGVPVATRLGALRDAHGIGTRPPPAHMQAYRRVDVAPAPWGEMLPLRLRQRVDAHYAMRVTETLHDALVSATERRLGKVPPLVHGCGEDGRRHLALVSLPDVGHRHADGHLIGVGVVLPRDATIEERTEISEILMGLDHIRLPGGVQLDFLVDTRGLRGLDPATWQRPSRIWTTVVPMIPDRYARRSRLAREIVRSLVLAGYPEPKHIHLHLHPVLNGAPHCREVRMTRAKQWTHVTVEWQRPVAGPLLAGRGRYFGSGLGRGIAT